MKRLVYATICGLIPMGLIGVGCSLTEGDLRSRLESRQAAERIQAIGEAGESGDSELVPALVDRLDDEDVAVRMYAILALERLTGHRLGYSYAAPAPERRESIAAWRRFIAESGSEDSGIQ